MLLIAARRRPVQAGY